jgi:hypothetical protein
MDLLTLADRGLPEARTPLLDAETYQDAWHRVRIVSASDTPLSATTRTWTNVATQFRCLPRRWNTVSVALLGYGSGTGAGDPGSGSCAWTLYVARRYGGPQIVATGTWAIGAMRASHTPWDGSAVADASHHKWGGLPVVTHDYWPSSVVAAGTTDQIGTLTFDPLGHWGLYLECTSVTGLTTLTVLATGR